MQGGGAAGSAGTSLNLPLPRSYECNIPVERNGIIEPCGWVPTSTANPERSWCGHQQVHISEAQKKEGLRKRAMNKENKEVLRRQREANETIAKERAAAQKSIEAIAAALGRELTTRTIAGVNELFGKALDRYGKVVRVFILQKSFHKIKSLSLWSDVHVRV